MVSGPDIVDGVAFALFFAASFGYHAFYLVITSHHPTWSARARMHRHRLNWVEAYMKRGERIMAVQTLRNLIMTNTFLASTMLLLLAFIANFVVVNPQQSLFGHEGESLLYGATSVSTKGVILLVLFGFAFVMFLTSLRNLNHLSVLVGIEPEQLRAIEDRDPALFIASKLNQVESMTTYGRRAVYFSLPVLAWFHSPWLFAATTIVIWVFFVFVMDFVRPARVAHPEAATRTATAPGLPK